jgi:hypothetical protein
VTLTYAQFVSLIFDWPDREDVEQLLAWAIQTYACGVQ